MCDKESNECWNTNYKFDIVTSENNLNNIWNNENYCENKYCVSSLFLVYVCGLMYNLLYLHILIDL